MEDRFADALVQGRLLKAADLEGVLQRALPGESAHHVLLREHAATEHQVAECFSSYFRIPFVRLATAAVDPGAVRLVDEAYAKRHRVFPVRYEHGVLVLAIENPLDLTPEQDLALEKSVTVRTVLATRTSIEDAIHRYYESSAQVADHLRDVAQSATVEIETRKHPLLEQDAVDLQQVASEPIVKLTNTILSQAIRRGASDIHVEPAVATVKVRYRVDGVLTEALEVPKWLQNTLVSRYKILAGLDIAERRVPQDGRIRTRIDNRAVDLRVSTLPTHYGEKVVLRVLDAGGTNLSLEHLGFGTEDLALLRECIHRPQGLVLTTGPTGSGKSSTLFACLNEIKSAGVNVVTIEDPIEFENPGLNQVQVNERAGLTFATVLRSVLRQDPNVILLGEIRDRETAEVALQASITGHLVLSTLHTNDAIATVTRLLDLGVTPSVLANALVVILAQRLLRRTCEKCREAVRPPEGMAERVGMSPSEPISRGRGCPDCQGTGFRGRVGVYELLVVDRNLRDLIAARAPEAELRKAAAATGFRSLLAAGVEKVRAGITSIPELLRVVEVPEDTSPKCPGCRRSIESDFAVCPFCGYSLRKSCWACGQGIRPEWRVCPFCRTASPLSPPAGAVEAVPGGSRPGAGNEAGTVAAAAAAGVATLTPDPGTGGAATRIAPVAPSPQPQAPGVDAVPHAPPITSAAPGNATPLGSAPTTSRVSILSGRVSSSVPPPATKPVVVAASAPVASPVTEPVPPFAAAAQLPHTGASAGTAAAAAASPTLEPEGILVPGMEKPRILVVDDQEDIRRLVCLFLRRLKYPVEAITAANGREALERVERDRPSMLLIDYQMPEMDGLEVCRRLRSNFDTAFIPIIMMTAAREQDTKARAYAAGTDDYVAKPINPADFKQKIERLLERTYGI